MNHIINYNQTKRKRLIGGSGKGKGVELVPLQRNKRGRLCAGMRDDIPFGVFGIDKHRLKNNILSLCRLTTRKKIDGLKNREVSPKFKFVMLELAQGIYIEDHIEALPTHEQELLSTIIKRSHVTGLEPPKTKFTDEELKNKLTVNLGEIKSGNDGKDLITETKQLLQMLSKKGYFTEFQVNHISKQFKLN